MSAPGYTVVTEEQVANARLIAAAPELLAALELIIQRMDNQKPGMGGAMHVREFTAEARAAIAKAKKGE
jgi:hypothetical protein